MVAVMFVIPGLPAVTVIWEGSWPVGCVVLIVPTVGCELLKAKAPGLGTTHGVRFAPPHTAGSLFSAVAWNCSVLAGAVAPCGTELCGVATGGMRTASVFWGSVTGMSALVAVPPLP